MDDMPNIRAFNGGMQMKGKSKIPAHAILSASGSSRWLSCAGSIRMSAGIVSKTSEYALLGTCAHELGELLLRGGKQAKEFIGSVIQGNAGNFTVDEDMASAVQVYVDLVRREFKAAGKGAELKLEHKFNLGWLYEGMFGTNDSVISRPFGLLTVVDYKHGAGIAVEVEDNPQLMFYALGAAKDETYEEVEIIICQPRAPHKDGPIRRCRMSIESLFQWGQEVLLPGAKATEDPNAPLSAGDHCRFCSALPICPEQRSKAIAVAKNAFADAPTPLPSPNALQPKDLKKILDAASMVKAWLEACATYAREGLEAGTLKPETIGYKLVEGRAPTRKWKDEKAAAEWLEMLVDDAFVHTLISPAAAEKLLKGDTKKALKELVEQGKPGVQLAPVSDKRPEVARSIGFDVVEVE